MKEGKDSFHQLQSQICQRVQTKLSTLPPTPGPFPGFLSQWMALPSIQLCNPGTRSQSALHCPLPPHTQSITKSYQRAPKHIHFSPLASHCLGPCYYHLSPGLLQQSTPAPHLLPPSDSQVAAAVTFRKLNLIRSLPFKILQCFPLS